MPWDSVRYARVTLYLEPEFTVSLTMIKGHDLSSNTTEYDNLIVKNC